MFTFHFSEPGFYDDEEEGEEFGLRIENVMYVKRSQTEVSIYTVVSGILFKIYTLTKL